MNKQIRESVSEEEWSARVELAALYRLVALYGWDDLVFTHISVRVPSEPEHFLLNPYGLLCISDSSLPTDPTAAPSPKDQGVFNEYS